MNTLMDMDSFFQTLDIENDLFCLSWELAAGFHLKWEIRMKMNINIQLPFTEKQNHIQSFFTVLFLCLSATPLLRYIYKHIHQTCCVYQQVSRCMLNLKKGEDEGIHNCSKCMYFKKYSWMDNNGYCIIILPLFPRYCHCWRNVPQAAAYN